MSTTLKEAQENITLAMLPEFELTGEDRVRVASWAALGAIDTGMDTEQACRRFRLTLEEIASHKEEWERMQTEEIELERSIEMMPA